MRDQSLTIGTALALYIQRNVHIQQFLYGVPQRAIDSIYLASDRNETRTSKQAAPKQQPQFQDRLQLTFFYEQHLSFQS